VLDKLKRLFQSGGMISVPPAQYKPGIHCKKCGKEISSPSDQFPSARLYCQECQPVMEPKSAKEYCQIISPEAAYNCRHIKIWQHMDHHFTNHFIPICTLDALERRCRGKCSKYDDSDIPPTHGIIKR